MPKKKETVKPDCVTFFDGRNTWKAAVLVYSMDKHPYYVASVHLGEDGLYSVDKLAKTEQHARFITLEAALKFAKEGLKAKLYVKAYTANDKSLRMRLMLTDVQYLKFDHGEGWELSARGENPKDMTHAEFVLKNIAHTKEAVESMETLFSSPWVRGAMVKQ